MDGILDSSSSVRYCSLYLKVSLIQIFPIIIINYIKWLIDWLVFNANFSNISAISWRCHNDKQLPNMVMSCDRKVLTVMVNTTPPILTKWTITSHLIKSLNIKTTTIYGIGNQGSGFGTDTKMWQGLNQLMRFQLSLSLSW